MNTIAYTDVFVVHIDSTMQITHVIQLIIYASNGVNKLEFVTNVMMDTLYNKINAQSEIHSVQ